MIIEEEKTMYEKKIRQENDALKLDSYLKSSYINLVKPFLQKEILERFSFCKACLNSKHVSIDADLSDYSERVPLIHLCPLFQHLLSERLRLSA